MSLLLLLLVVLWFIGLDLLRRKRKSTVPPPVIVRRYGHAGHSWLRMTPDGDALVGIDDFAQTLIGSVESIELPRLLQRVEQGAIGWRLTHGHRVVPMLCPVSGRVIEKNEMVLRDPRLINVSPYRDGWLLRIRPTNVQSQMHNLLTGKLLQQWLEQKKESLVRFFSTTPALMYQDGGFIVNNLSDRMSDEEWDNLSQEIFLVTNNNPTKQQWSFFHAPSTNTD
ncbi:MAG: glycine cleavage system protein H, partial [bacterium]